MPKDKINYNEIDPGKIPASVLYESVWGDGGIQDRVCRKIETLGLTEAAKIKGCKKQGCEHFLKYKKLKFSTIMEWAKALEVE